MSLISSSFYDEGPDDEPRDDHGRWTSAAEAYQNNPSDDRARAALTLLSSKTIIGGTHEHLHPGEITVYRAGKFGKKGTSFSKSKEQARKQLFHGETKIYSLKLTKNTPAIDMNKLNPDSRYSHEKEVFVNTRKLRDSKRSVDPGNTRYIHKSFRAAADMQLNRLRSTLRQAVVDINVLGLSGPSNFTFMAPAARLNQFAGWLETAANASLDARWWVHPWVDKATQHGLRAAQSEMNGNEYQPVPTTFESLHQMSHDELRGIIGAMTQKVMRAAHKATILGLVPHQAFREMVKPIDGDIRNRLRMFAHYMTVKGHVHGKVAYYRHHGITHVGVNAELLKRHRIVHDADEAEVAWQTAEDDEVCDQCEEMAQGSPYTVEEVLDLIPLHPWCRCEPVIWDGPVELKDMFRCDIVYDFDPDEERDEHGRWTSGGGSEEKKPDNGIRETILTPAQQKKISGMGRIHGDYHPLATEINALPKDVKIVRSEEPLEHHDSKKQVYIRFGDIPKGEVSKVGQSPSALHMMLGIHEGQELEGVSVFPVKYNKDRNLWQVDDYSLGESGVASLDQLLADQWTYDNVFLAGGHVDHPPDEDHPYRWQTWSPPVYYYKRFNSRPIYLVTGKEQDEPGTDGEPLLKKVKILGKVGYQDIFHKGYFDPDEDIRPEHNPELFGIKLPPKKK